MMSKTSKKTITLSLNFNNEHEYRFTVDIGCGQFTWKQAGELVGSNCFEEKFELHHLGHTVMFLLVLFGHATALGDASDWDEQAPWNVLAERRSAPHWRRGLPMS